MESEAFIHPVTALAFLRLERLYVVAGQGNCIKIFDYEAGKLLSSKSVFDAQVIHGICQSSPDTAQRHQPMTVRILIWGGRSVCLLELSEGGSATEAEVLRVGMRLEETEMNDWILDASFRPPVPAGDVKTRSTTALVSAHNELWILEDDVHKIAQVAKVSRRHLSSGPNSVLYSADVCWTDSRTIVVASGTVIGEIHVWSASYQGPNNPSALSELLYTLPGHEGSVFGICISHEITEDGGRTRMLASCSDDRTIKLWDISGIDNPDVCAQSAGQCLAEVMGHASRIWKTQFRPTSTGAIRVITIGEDGTAQSWRFAPSSHARDNCSVSLEMTLQHEMTWAYHFGKNVWALDLSTDFDGCQVIASGGADGRIISWVVGDAGQSQSVKSFQCSTSEAFKSVKELDVESKDEEPVVPSKYSIYNAMIGEWKLSRRIDSAVLPNPSGTFSGMARLDPRTITDDFYDAESLYSEEGDFASDNGLKFKARKQYIYRYQERSDEISIWFVKQDGATVDKLFHKLSFEDCAPATVSKTHPDIRANGHHFCEPDTYHPEYRFSFIGGQLRSWQIVYTVKGPQKDYISTATYFPNSPDHHQLSEASILEACPSFTDFTHVHKSKSDSFKAYAWISQSSFLATTQQGYLILGSIAPHQSQGDSECYWLDNIAKSHISWRIIGHDPSLQGASMITGLPSSQIAFVTGQDGKIMGYSSSRDVMSIVYEAKTKMGFMGAQVNYSLRAELASDNGQYDVSLIFRSLGWPSSRMVSISTSEFLSSCSQEKDDHRLESHPQAYEFVTTSCMVLNTGGFLVEGSRHGDLRISAEACERPLVLGAKFHQSNAITVILQLFKKADRYQTYFLTAGRDGTYAIHKLSYVASKPHLFEISTLQVCSLPFGPNIEGARIDTNDHLILWGFDSTRFVTWNESMKSEIMSIECGGAHRTWSYLHHDQTGGGSLVWTQAKACHVHHQSQPSHSVLQHGGHGREIKAVAISPRSAKKGDQAGCQLIATGAEDTAVRLFEHKEGEFECHNVMNDHTSGIQQLRWSSDGRWLFSAAGCEELFAWRVRYLNGIPYVVCDAVCPAVTDDKALRVMNLTITNTLSARRTLDPKPDHIINTIYSDSSIRTWHFRTKPSAAESQAERFTLLRSSSYKTNCLTQIQALPALPGPVLCVASSDGHLTFWQSGSIQALISNPEPQVHGVHQSSIKTLMFIALTSKSSASEADGTSNDFLIITGGDDQAIAITRLTYHNASKPPQISTLLIPNAHASAVTGLALLSRTDGDDSCRFASVGTDQRLKTWAVRIDPSRKGVEGVRVERVGDAYTGVADASGMESYGGEDGAPRLVVVGIGMECWRASELLKRNGLKK